MVEKPPTRPDLLAVKVHMGQRQYIKAMADIFVKAFDRNRCFPLMYTGSEIRPVIEAILHGHIGDDSRVIFRVAEKKDTKEIVSWISVGVIKAEGYVPEYAYSEMTSWAALKLLGDDTENPRHRLATKLNDYNRAGQEKYMPKDRHVINALVTLPEYWNRGVARNLLRTTVDRAEYMNRALWVQTPFFWSRLFEFRRFSYLEEFSLDLNEYRDKAAGGEEAEAAREPSPDIMMWAQMKVPSGTETQLDIRQSIEFPALGSSTGACKW